jgi:hypothetical protein
MQRRKQRPRLDIECSFGNLVNSAGYTDAMVAIQRKRSENEQIQRAAQQFGS